MYAGQPIRVLIVPGLRDSGEDHWQTWLQRQYAGAARVQQDDWTRPDLQAWSRRIAQTVQRHPASTAWVAVAHSFGCLALAHYLRGLPEGRRGDFGVQSALLVAPADPEKFGVAAELRRNGLRIPATLVGSENDPWMPLERAQSWARDWSARFINQGPAGHINAESGHGPWPLARWLVDQMIRDRQRQRRLQRAHPLELNYAI